MVASVQLIKALGDGWEAEIPSLSGDSNVAQFKKCCKSSWILNAGNMRDEKEGT